MLLIFSEITARVYFQLQTCAWHLLNFTVKVQQIVFSTQVVTIQQLYFGGGGGGGFQPSPLRYNSIVSHMQRDVQTWRFYFTRLYARLVFMQMSIYSVFKCQLILYWKISFLSLQISVYSLYENIICLPSKYANASLVCMQISIYTVWKLSFF